MHLFGVAQNPANGFPARLLVLQRRIIWRRDFWGEIELGDVVPQASYDSWLGVRQEASAGFFHQPSL